MVSPLGEMGKKVKQSSKKDLIKKAQESITSVFKDVPFLTRLEIKSNKKTINREIDLVLNAYVSGRPVQFFIEIKSEGEPRFVRMLVLELKDYLKSTNGSYGILMAPYFSETSREICKEAGIGCIDFAGNAYVSFKNIYIDRQGNPNPFTGSRASKSVFSPKSSRVLRVLLADPSRKWFVEDLSHEANISIGLTSKVKQFLFTQEWIKDENKRFYLVKPEEMIDQWANNYSYLKNTIFSFYSDSSEEEIEASIKKECDKRKCRYGIALFSGAKKVAPHVRFMKFFSYIDEHIENIAKTLQFKKVESGANVTLLQPYDEGIFYGLQNIQGMNIVSDIQLYLDLKGYKGRGEEAAQAIFEKRIKAKW